jgi:hypothetical protein
MLLPLAAFLAVRGFGPRLITRLFVRFLHLPWWARVAVVLTLALFGWWVARRNRGGGPPGWGGRGRSAA